MGQFFKRLSMAVVAVACATSAFAADLPEPVIEHVPQIPAVGGWYLRGDIGYKVYGDPSGSFRDGVIGDLRYVRESMDDAVNIGVGVGYRFNEYFRSDLTVDYETPSSAKGYAFCGLCTGNLSTEGADIDVWTVMFNGYVDLGTWYNITPYVGAGIGASYVRASNAYSINPGSTGTVNYSGTNGEWNLAWALMAGAAYDINPNWTIDAGYQYRNLGMAKTVRHTGVGTGGTRAKWDDLVAHEVRLGLRYNFGGAPVYYAPQAISSNF
ncbi:outer membrane protein [Roseibium aestuarii]|uniref:Outer membrane protein n=1 Tax=Roseibium aestuarii TaxID=2600299 RepID=A0ABW4JZQ5_9HYPH|nr:outer membrane protein [Roseibium aestuarii]